MSRIEKVARTGPIKELGDSNVIAMLGKNPVYVHSNERLAERGMEQVTLLLKKVFKQKWDIVKRRALNIKKGLESKQQKISSALGFSNVKDMEESFKIIVKGNEETNGEFGTLIKNVLEIKELLTNTYFGFRAKDRKEFVEKIQEKAKSLQDFITKESKNREDKKLFGHLEEVTEILNSLKAIPKRQGRSFDQPMSKLKQILRNLPSVLGFAQEEAVALAFENFAEKILGEKVIARTVGKEQLGGKKEGYGASDVAVKIPNCEFELTFSVKLRETTIGEDYSYFYDESGKRTAKSYIGSSATSGNIEKYFSTNNQNTFKLKKEEQSYLAYGIANSIAFKRSENFDFYVDNLVIGQRLLFAILGEDWNKKSTNKLPLYLIEKDMLFSVPEILEWITKLKPEDLSDLIVYDTGNWKTGFFTGKEELKKVKRFKITNIVKKKENLSYSILKEEIKNVLATVMESPYNKFFKATYRIFTSNLPKL